MSTFLWSAFHIKVTWNWLESKRTEILYSNPFTGFIILIELMESFKKISSDLDIGKTIGQAFFFVHMYVHVLSVTCYSDLSIVRAHVARNPCWWLRSRGRSIAWRWCLTDEEDSLPASASVQKNRLTWMYTRMYTWMYTRKSVTSGVYISRGQQSNGSVCRKEHFGTQGE